jgi:hypothetical protein
VTNLYRRLQKLEALRTDASALIPYSPPWFAYWDEQICLHINEGEGRPGKLPHEALVSVLRHIVQRPASVVGTIPISNAGVSGEHRNAGLR